MDVPQTIEKDAATQKFNIIQGFVGHENVQQKRYRELDIQIKNIRAQYQTVDCVLYLRAVASLT